MRNVAAGHFIPSVYRSRTPDDADAVDDENDEDEPALNDRSLPSLCSAEFVNDPL